MIRRSSILAIAFVCTVQVVYAQHSMKDMPDMDRKSQVKKERKNNNNNEDMSGMDMSDSAKMKGMSSGLSRNLPMSQDGSGTSWEPAASPLYGYMIHADKWMLMFNGDLFIRYNKQDITGAGSRGGEKWDAPDMLMAMAQRNAGKRGLARFNVMISTDAVIAGGNGYPLLFQTGESWDGKPLVDRQHPHDLFSELSASYAYALSEKTDISIYAGYPGEPALGPVTFMHRPSGKFIPDAPIGHHWADATHITFGVATLGLRYSKFKIEGSSFTGREPDENRYDLDKPLFDSWSGRVSFNPSANLALQASHGFIKSLESLHPTEDINRTTASATYLYPMTVNNYFTGTALWGQNKIPNEDASNSALLEATFKVKKVELYTRYEWVEKSGEELDLNVLKYGSHSLYPVNTVTVGGGYDLFSIGQLMFAAGAQLSIAHEVDELTVLYGQNPISGEVSLHIYPGLVK